MKLPRRFFERYVVAPAAASLLLTIASIAKAQDDLPPQASAASDQTASAGGDAEVEVLTSGPVHEAFANPATESADEGYVTPEAPPEPIDELPPKVVPEGENVEWIPGYWSWSDDRNDFLWVSGLWRNVPPDQRWVPGHWVQVDSGYRWISGFWAPADSQTLEYLPYPPASQEQGPNVPAPGEGYFWMPGSWVYANGDYQWQPGYWADAQDDWCWTPQHYVWTPRGALYTPGYWDYRLPYRGTLFAPVSFANRGYYSGGRRYTPGYVINPSSLLVSLFVRPNYGHYYFGNYYGDEFSQLGYRPWYDASYRGQYHYDPLLAFYESYYDRRGVDFSGRVNQWFNYYDQNPDVRPARTWSEASQLRAGADTVETNRLTFAQPFDEVMAGDAQNQRRFRELTDDQRVEFADASSNFREVVQNRNRAESNTSADARVKKADADARGEADANTAKRTPRGESPARSKNRLQLPEDSRRGREILGDAKPRRETNEPETVGERDKDTPEQESPRQQPRGRSGSERSPDQRSQPQPPQRPNGQPQADDRSNPPATPDGRKRGSDQTQADPSKNERQQPNRNIFQPRRGNFPERSNDGNRGQKFQMDPRDSIPQFGGGQNAQPNQRQGQSDRQGQNKSKAPPAAEKQGNRGGGDRDNKSNRGNGERD